MEAAENATIAALKAKCAAEVLNEKAKSAHVRANVLRAIS